MFARDMGRSGLPCNVWAGPQRASSGATRMSEQLQWWAGDWAPAKALRNALLISLAVHVAWVGAVWRWVVTQPATPHELRVELAAAARPSVAAASDQAPSAPQLEAS